MISPYHKIKEIVSAERGRGIEPALNDSEVERIAYGITVRRSHVYEVVAEVVPKSREEAFLKKYGMK